MKKIAITLAAALLLCVHAAPAAAQTAAAPGLFPSAMSGLDALFSGQAGSPESPDILQQFANADPASPGTVSLLMQDRLDALLTSSTPALPPLSWGGTGAVPGGLVSPLFDSLDATFSRPLGDFGLDPNRIPGPGIYFGNAAVRSGMVTSKSSTVITGMSGQMPGIDFQQTGSADSETIRGYFIEIRPPGIPVP